MMQLAKKIPFEDPDVLLMVRGFYILSNVLILGLYLYVQSQISKKKGTLAYASLVACSAVSPNTNYRYVDAQVCRACPDGHW